MADIRIINEWLEKADDDFYLRETALKLYTSADNIAQTIRKKLDLKLVGGQ